MKHIIHTRLLVAATFGLLGSAVAQTPTAEVAAAMLTKTPELQEMNRISVAYQMSFNMSVNFKNLGGYPLPAGINPGPPTGYQENRTYEDGYNKLDDNLNTYGDLHATRNWGYLHDSGPNNQIIDTADSRFIAMHATSAAGGLSVRDDGNEPQPGFEITYSRTLQDHGTWQWGVDAALGYSRFEADNHQTLTGDAQQLTDLFEVPLDTATGERYVPPAPYSGGPFVGPLLGSDPMRTNVTFSGASTVSGKRSFDANIFDIKLGPYLQYSLGKNAAVALNGGLSIVVVSSDFSYTETVSMSGLGVDPLVKPGGSGSNAGVEIGGYVGGLFSYKFGKNWGAYAGVQYQSAGDYTHQENDKKAVLDLGGTVFVSIGASYSF